MINIGEVLLNLWESSGFAYIFANFMGGGWQRSEEHTSELQSRE